MTIKEEIRRLKLSSYYFNNLFATNEEIQRYISIPWNLVKDYQEEMVKAHNTILKSKQTIWK